ncbi:hypothetical protein Mapa_013081 [Marchantia paleacea]|nr:hypothetical protein Mapa_013081 [Marchantia paleacea]
MARNHNETREFDSKDPKGNFFLQTICNHFAREMALRESRYIDITLTLDRFL